jgi:DNA repair protein RadC
VFLIIYRLNGKGKYPYKIESRDHSLRVFIFGDSMATLQTYEKAAVQAETDTSSLDIRERMLRFGSGAISNLDLVVAILGTGVPGKPVRKLAKEVLNQITQSTHTFDIDKLMLIAGMGEAKSCAVAAAIELGRRIFSIRGTRIGMPKDAFPLLVHYADIRQEHFIVISLNGGHEVNAVREITKGLINKTVVHPREVFADPSPTGMRRHRRAQSPQRQPRTFGRSLDITHRLRQSGDILGIPVTGSPIFRRQAISVLWSTDLSPRWWRADNADWPPRPEASLRIGAGDRCEGRKKGADFRH